MKLIVTKNEILALFRKTYNLPDAVVIEVDSALEPLPCIDAQEKIKSIISRVESLKYKDSGKIPAIKLVREYGPSNLILGYGLRDAKWIVEHWALFKDWLTKQQNFPILIWDENQSVMLTHSSST